MHYGIKAENLDVIFHKVSTILLLHTYCPYMGNYLIVGNCDCQDNRHGK